MRTFPAIPQSVHAARRFATDTLRGSGVRTLEAIELMVSELATNCIRHERASFHIAILGSAREIRIEVTDSGSGTPMMRSPGPDEPSGRGLQIVDMLSERWGVVPEEPSGKTVWFTVPAATEVPAGIDDVPSRRRIGSDASPVVGAPSSVQWAEKTPNGPTSLYRCGPSRYRVPCGLRSARVLGQGRRSRLRYCLHDECGSHARPRRDLERLR
jgi:anti-sigma regulatory factor (Ser/Thr protein kinase)